MNLIDITKRDKVNILLFKLLLIVQYGFFLLIPIAQISRGLAYTPWASLLIVSVMWVNSLERTDELGILVYFFVLVNVCSFIYVVVHYGYIDKTAFIGVGYGLLALVYFPLRKISKKIDIMRVMAFINIMAVVIILIQVLYFNIFGSTLIHSFDPAKLQIRNGLRITYYDYIVLINIAISIGKIFEKKSFLNLLNLLLSIIYIFYVSQTRYIEVVAFIIIAIVGVMYVWKYLKNGYVTFLSVVIIFIILPISIIAIHTIYTALIQPIIDGSYINIGSYFARLGEIEFYRDALKNNLLFGLGNFSTSVGSMSWTTIHGPEGIFYTQDLGLFGDVVKLGIPMLLIFILFVVFLNKKAYRKFSNLTLKLIIYSSIGTISIFGNGFVLGLILALIVVDKNSRRNYSVEN
ncbi:hypothetical protein I6H67_06415 [Pediococcus pentosaceus]|uniref:hypothetical protein n=1 Tax=Pediococcus pentosaceus TaxID=1255 RepID=UPI0018E0CCBD|nr:hypothetical protein [Pediococcus pentosaceus]MBF7104693.1 hypothetical protein [Pediococcus pentosaceus]QQC60867.1 hypothetical protein I6H67_06415 [Pediococcus pentosaceus]